MSELTLEQAIDAMRKGAKVAHRGYTNEEWASLRGNVIRYEDGVEEFLSDFLKRKTQEHWQSGWFVIEETFKYKNWKAVVNYRENLLTFTTAGETREYPMSMITSVEQENEYLFVKIKGGAKGAIPFSFQRVVNFKFEEDNFLVADIFDLDGEFLDSFASYVFGEK